MSQFESLFVLESPTADLERLDLALVGRLAATVDQGLGRPGVRSAAGEVCHENGRHLARIAIHELDRLKRCVACENKSDPAFPWHENGK